eukprot:COSAG01_NODE_1220_length_11162_cov_107.350176_6_plen_186_part_00
MHSRLVYDVVTSERAGQYGFLLYVRRITVVSTMAKRPNRNACTICAFEDAKTSCVVASQMQAASRRPHLSWHCAHGHDPDWPCTELVADPGGAHVHTAGRRSVMAAVCSRQIDLVTHWSVHAAPRMTMPDRSFKCRCRTPICTAAIRRSGTISSGYARLLSRIRYRRQSRLRDRTQPAPHRPSMQ